MTRKRKKCPSAHLAGSSADEDSEHEPIKTTNYDGEEKGGEEEGEREKKESDEGVHTCSKKEKRQENLLTAADTTEGKAADDHSNRCLCSQTQTHSTYSRPPPATTTPSHLKNMSMASGRPTIPLWISPKRPPNLYRASGSHNYQQPDWNQATPVQHRKTRGGRLRATSMNLDRDLGLSEDRVRGWSSDRVEVIQVSEEMPPQCGPIIHSSLAQPADPFPLSLSSGWLGSGSHGLYSVVLRNSARDPRGQTRVWRRHTVLI